MKILHCESSQTLRQVPREAVASAS